MKYFLLMFLFFSCAGHHKHEKHRFDNVDKWVKVFENKDRDKWQMPDKVIKAMDIKVDSKVADIGSATGYFPIKFAKAAPKGRVWAIDIEPNLVRFLNNRAQKERLDNLFSILGTHSSPLIPEPVDFIFIVNTYHHITHRKKYFELLRSKLNEYGAICIIDFKKEKLPIGPKEQAKISKTEIIKEMKLAGYKLHKSFDFLKYQNFLVFR